MESMDAILMLVLLLGSLGVFASMWYFARKGPPTEPFFLRFLRIENKSARVDTRIELYRLNSKVEELSAMVKRIDTELQWMLDSHKKEKGISPDQPFAGPEKGIHQKLQQSLSGMQKCQEIYRLFGEGLSPGEIAENLQVGQGEVELILSLDKKPSWVIHERNGLNK